VPNTKSNIPLLTPRADVHATEDALVLLMDLPGVLPADLSVRLDRGLLFIEGVERNPEGVAGARLRRALAVQQRVDTAAIQATLRDGVLTLRLPRPGTDHPRHTDLLEA
jgi:HSP20 family protein